jgi:hypothetical protein
VIERGRGPGLLLEAEDSAGIAREVGGQELQCLSKRVDLRLVGRLEFGSGAVAMRYEPRR